MKAVKSTSSSSASGGFTRVALYASLVALGAGLALGYVAGTRAGTNAARPETALSSGVQAREVVNADGTLGLVIEPLPADADVAQILSRVRDETNPNRQRAEIDALCAALDVPAIRALLDGIDESKGYSFRYELAGGLLTRWAEIDPRAAADYALAAAKKQRLYSLQSVINVWAEENVDEAVEWAMQVTDRQLRYFSVSSILAVLAETNPDEAFALLEELPATDNRGFHIQSLFQTLARKSPSQAAELATQITSPRLRGPAVREVAQIWSQTQPAKAFEWFIKNSVAAQEDDWSMDDEEKRMIANWARVDRAEAVAFATAQPVGRLRSQLISKLAENWAQSDPQAAAKWLVGLPKSPESYRAFSQLVGTWSSSDPATAADFIMSRPSERTRDWLLDTLGSSWVEQNPQAALAWAQKQEGADIDRSVAAKALGELAAKDLANLGTYLAQARTPEGRTSTIIAVASKLTNEDPRQSADWVMQIAQTEKVGRAIEYPISTWTWRDPDAVSAWLNEQPAGAQKDAAVGAFARNYAQKEGFAAATWATSIEDAELRTKRVNEVVGTWANKDAKAASAWVDGQNFDAARLKELQGVITRARGE